MFSKLRGYIGWLLGLLIVICIFLLYSWFDSLVSLDYAHQEQKYRHEEIAVLQSLLLETGKRMSRSEIKQLVTKSMGKDNVKWEEQNELSIEGGIVLKFRGDSLVEVKSLNEYE